jgi:hypothetical protein
MDRRREESMTSIGERLYSASWRQGSLFRGEGLAVTRNVLANLSHDLRQPGWPKHDQGQDQDQHELPWPNAEDIHQRQVPK